MKRGMMIYWMEEGWTIHLTSPDDKASTILMDAMDACEEVLAALKRTGEVVVDRNTVVDFIKEGGLLCTSAPSAQERQ